uniref:DUF5641 domain-containing protein n=1 Tax=Anopheles epiroticus TaxID=199890 RepID=A0A182PX68_9DIPT
TSSVDRQQFRLVQHQAKLFWDKWKKEYLPTLVKRDKWTSKVVPIKQGDIVVITDDNAPPGVWLKGRVIKAHLAKDEQDSPSVRIGPCKLGATSWKAALRRESLSVETLREGARPWLARSASFDDGKQRAYIAVRSPEASRDQSPSR